MKQIWAILAITLMVVPASFGFHSLVIGSSVTSGMAAITTGVGRNDGYINGYALSEAGEVFEFRYSPWWGWSQQLIAQRSSGHVGDIVVGEGRSDGVKRLYFSGSDGSNYGVYEQTFNNTNNTWGTPIRIWANVAGGGQIRQIQIAAGRPGDTKKRVYIVTFSRNKIAPLAGPGGGLPQNGEVYELDYVAPNWIPQLVGTVGQGGVLGGGVAVGNGRNDNPSVARVYSTSQDGSSMREFTYQSGNWVQTWPDFAIGGLIYHIELGKARNTSTNYLYIAGEQRTREVRWNGSSFEKADLPAHNPNGSWDLDVTIGDGFNDGLSDVQVFVASGWGYIACYRWTGSAWELFPDHVGSGGGQMRGCATGNGRNSYAYSAVYGACWDRNAYEFWTDSPPLSPSGAEEGHQVGAQNNDFFIQCSPNPMKTSTLISYQLPAPSHVSVRVYDLSGRLVGSLINADQGAGLHTVVWDGKKDRGEIVPPGIYLYRLEVGNFKATNRVVVVR